MARKKKSKVLDNYVMAEMPADEAARHAAHNHPEVCALETSLRKAIASTIKRVMSHRPLVRKQTRRKR